ncbi:hypothetical protein V8E55_001407, partial [Tylopilus felleus]
KATKDNLPLIMQNNPDKKWSKVVLPCILLWYGDQANVWSIKKADLDDIIINVVCYVYPSLVGDKSNLVQMQHGGCIYDLVYRRFIYEGFDIESMAFQSSLLLTLLGFTHLHDTAISKTTLVCAVCKVLEMGDLSVEMAVQTVQTRVVLLMVGWVEVPGMDLLAKCDHGIKGVLALCTAALEHALTLVQEGRLDTVVDEEAQVATVARQEVVDTSIRSIRSNRKQPLSLNQATGKLSTKGSAFSHQNWGGHMTSYYKSIATRDADVLGDIVAKALIHLAIHHDDDALFATLISPNGLDDPRANMCRHLLIIQDTH